MKDVNDFQGVNKRVFLSDKLRNDAYGVWATSSVEMWDCSFHSDNWIPKKNHFQQDKT